MLSHYFAPGRLQQNGSMESFNGRDGDNRRVGRLERALAQRRGCRRLDRRGVENRLRPRKRASTASRSLATHREQRHSDRGTACGRHHVRSNANTAKDG